MREHLLLSATKCDGCTNFVREVESIEHAKKTVSGPTPMEIDSFQGKCHKCGKYGHTAKECRDSSHGGAEKPQCALCRKNIMDSVGHGATRHPTKIHRKEDGKVTEKGNGKRTQKGGTSKGGKGGNQGKGKGDGKKGQRLNEIKEATRRPLDREILGTTVRSILERRSRHCELAER